MGIPEDLAECLQVDLEGFDPSILVDILTGFIEFIPKLVNPLELGDLLPNLTPEKLPGLFLGSAAAQIPAPFGTLKIPKPPGLNIEVFNPEGLVKMITGLTGIALEIPGLFGLSLDLEKLVGPPISVPEIPSFNALVGLIGIQLGLTPPGVDPEFAGKFSTCIAKLIAGPLNIPLPNS